MAAQLQAILLWLASFLEDDAGHTSVKKLIYVAAGFTFLGVIIGLSVPVAQDRKLAADILETLIWAVIGMATGGYLIGKKIEKKEPTDGQGGS